MTIRRISILISALVAIVAGCIVTGTYIAALVMGVNDLPDTATDRTLLRVLDGGTLLFFAWGLSLGWADGSADYGRHGNKDAAKSGTSRGSRSMSVVGRIVSQLMGIGFAGAGFIVLYLAIA